MILDKSRVRWTLAAVALLVMVAGFLPGILQAGAVEDALIGWWKFDEASGLIAADSGGLGNDGSLRGGAEFTSDSLLGGAVNFIGTEHDNVMVPWNESLEPETGTFQAWIKVGGLHDADIVAKTTDWQVRSIYGPVNKSVYGLRVSADGFVLAFIGNDADQVDFWTVLEPLDVLITENAWHHLAMRWDGTTCAVFVDGVIRDEKWYWAIPGIGLSYSGNSAFYLGKATNGTYGGEFDGQMDEVRFFGWARSDKEIYKDFKKRGLKPPKHKAEKK